MRNIPKFKIGNSLLDVGCGNGKFLQQAKLYGWHVTGLDVDDNALRVAESRGVDVYKMQVEEFSKEEIKFDIITMNQVIEHVPDPHETLRACYNILKPGGSLWIATPNIESVGHEYYESDWRGIEAPRHLVIFSCASLTRILESIGFRNIKHLPYKPACSGMFRGSAEINFARLKGNGDNLLKDADRKTKIGEKIEKKYINRREFINLVASKPR